MTKQPKQVCSVCMQAINPPNQLWKSVDACANCVMKVAKEIQEKSQQPKECIHGCKIENCGNCELESTDMTQNPQLESKKCEHRRITRAETLEEAIKIVERMKITTQPILSIHYEKESEGDFVKRIHNLALTDTIEALKKL